MTIPLRPVRTIILTLALALSTAAVQARAPEVYLDQGGVFGKAWEYAADGYDVVAYYGLDEGAAPVAGNDAYTTRYKGVQWRFSSRENLEAFEADPARYAPAYGGYCAWAMARGQLAKGAPDAWYVHGGKLYLNVNKRIQRRWLSDLENEVAQGDANWPAALDNE